MSEGTRPRSGRFRRATYEILTVGGHHPLSRPFDLFITSLIAANVLAVMLATVDPLYSAYRDAFVWFEVFSVAVFAVEYLGRLWSCTVAGGYEGPISGRLGYATRPMLVVDLLAILPFFLSGMVVDFRFLRAFRLLRFLRLFKLARYSETVRAFGYVARDKRDDLTVALSATVILLVVASSLMYFAERGAQPEAFSSIPEALWWGVVTLTTVGYGDVYPVTAVGRALGAVISVLGVGLVALPAGILASGFVEEGNRTDGVCPHCGRFVDELEDPTDHFGTDE